MLIQTQVIITTASIYKVWTVMPRATHWHHERDRPWFLLVSLGVLHLCLFNYVDYDDNLIIMTMMTRRRIMMMISIISIIILCQSSLKPFGRSNKETVRRTNLNYINIIDYVHFKQVYHIISCFLKLDDHYCFFWPTFYLDKTTGNHNDCPQVSTWYYIHGELKKKSGASYNSPNAPYPAFSSI